MTKYYTGSKAQSYEADRRDQAKWKWENATVSSLLKDLEFDSVIDAPVGTGRFLHLYDTRVYCFDISQDMIDIAKAKGVDAEYRRCDLVRDQLPIEADLIVSIRFLNLIDAAQTKRALDNLLSSARRYAIFTMLTVPDDYKGKMKLGRVYLHWDKLAREVVERNCFEIVGRYPYEDNVPGSYQIFLCRRV